MKFEFSRLLNLTHVHRYYKFTFYLALLFVTVMMLLPVPEQAAASINDKLMHILIFFILALLLDKAYPLTKLIPLLALLLVGYGLLIEVLQGMTAYRSFSWVDWIADAFGVLCYFLIYRLLS